MRTLVVIIIISFIIIASKLCGFIRDTTQQWGREEESERGREGEGERYREVEEGSGEITKGGLREKDGFYAAYSKAV